MRRGPEVGNARKREEILTARPMSSSWIVVVGLILVLSQWTASSSMVLPRPPSFPNHIQQSRKLDDPKLYNEKALQGRRINRIRNPDDVNGYGLLEIELHGADMDPTSLRNLVHTLLKNERMANYSQDPFQVEPIDPRAISDKDEALIDPLRPINDKLYYLKNARPKIRANFLTNNRRLPPPEGHLQLARKTFDKKYRAAKGYRPKKFYPGIDTGMITTGRIDHSLHPAARRGYDLKDETYGTKSYKDTEDDPSTTEPSSVTSSELPKQIPAPPSRLPGGQVFVAQTTPVQKYVFQRTDILPGYGFHED